jgi:hypothetical protein
MILDQGKNVKKISPKTKLFKKRYFFLAWIVFALIIQICNVDNNSNDHSSKNIYNNKVINYNYRKLTTSDRAKISLEIIKLAGSEKEKLILFKKNHPYEKDLNKIITARAAFLIAKSSVNFSKKFENKFELDVSLLILAKLARIQGMAMSKNEILNISQYKSDKLASERDDMLTVIKKRNNNFLFLD